MANPYWLLELHRLREADRVPLARCVTLSLIGRLASHCPHVAVPDPYHPEPGDCMAALAGLSVEVVFDEACGFHRLRILCENILHADPVRLVLLAIGWRRSTFVVLKCGGQS